MKKKMKVGITCLLLIMTSTLFADSPVWFTNLRDAVYEQRLSSNEVASIYTTAKTQAQTIASEAEKFVMLARIENLMGMVYQREGQNNEARVYYERGENYANLALAAQRTSDGFFVLAESISLLCGIRGFGYQVANGQRFINNANRAINLNQNNFEAKYLLAASDAFADPPFRNLGRAKRRLDEILENINESTPKNIRFNVYYAMGIVFQKQRQPVDARYWFNKALTLYPTNIDVRNRLGEI